MGKKGVPPGYAAKKVGQYLRDVKDELDTDA